MIYAVILAAGKGSRMETSMPKQYLKIKDKELIILTIEKFYNIEEIDYIYLGVDKSYLEYTKELLENNNLKNKIKVVEGGNTRFETLEKIFSSIDNISKEDIVITHDGARPNVTEKIIKENIEEIKKSETEIGVVTAVPTIDTILKVEEGFVKEVPIRSSLYNAQTPQTFRLEKINNLIKNLTNEEKLLYTDLTKVYIKNNIPVKVIKGDYENFKITNKLDLKIANEVLK